MLTGLISIVNLSLYNPFSRQTAKIIDATQCLDKISCYLNHNESRLITSKLVIVINPSSNYVKWAQQNKQVAFYMVEKYAL